KSYALFKQRKDEGVIPKHVKFQVSLPGTLNALGLFRLEFQEEMDPQYEDALYRSLQKIVDGTPHCELAVQVDVASEFAFLESADGVFFNCYLEPPLFPKIISRLARLANRVPKDVELGFHLRYGDIGHRHFVEPKDVGLMVEVGNALHKCVQREIQWLHLPVPKERKDVEYFELLRGLKWEVPELYLGLVHEGDEEGTRERIAAAGKVLGEREFGVATECGMGRISSEDVEDIIKIMKTVSAEL
ncbi:hypothetical protein CC80DRAFT_568808, partial [Byssothecium circinans]